MSKRKSRDEVKFPIDWNAFERKAFERLKEIQPILLPQKADHIVAIEPESGGYVVAKTREEAMKMFQRRFQGKLFFLIRADGGPTRKIHHK